MRREQYKWMGWGGVIACMCIWAVACESGGNWDDDDDDYESSAQSDGPDDPSTEALEEWSASTVPEGEPCAPALGLYADADCVEINEGIYAFTPQYPLWSDGVAKARYVWIPPGATIDVSDPNSWVFPVGTRLWKHFETSEGERLETRVIEKTANLKGVEGWTFETYLWNEAGNDVISVTDGVQDVLGTEHDIPAIKDCNECHSGGENQWDSSLSQDDLLDLPLGFGAIQLHHEGSETTLEDLISEGWLSGDIDVEDAVIPGSPEAQAALGYLHANCGSCHGGAKPAKEFTMHVPVGLTAAADSPTYLHTINKATDPNKKATGLENMPTIRVAPGDPENSALLWRMKQRGHDDAQMPPLATDVVDAEGVATIEAWIESLQ